MKIYDEECFNQAKAGAKLKMVGWNYEESAYVKLEECNSMLNFYLYRQPPYVVCEMFNIGYNSLIADWVIV